MGDPYNVTVDCTGRKRLVPDSPCVVLLPLSVSMPLFLSHIQTFYVFIFKKNYINLNKISKSYLCNYGTLLCKISY